jgi:hypothetical protein
VVAERRFKLDSLTGSGVQCPDARHLPSCRPRVITKSRLMQPHHIPKTTYMSRNSLEKNQIRREEPQSRRCNRKVAGRAIAWIF